MPGREIRPGRSWLMLLWRGYVVRRRQSTQVRTKKYAPSSSLSRTDYLDLGLFCPPLFADEYMDFWLGQSVSAVDAEDTSRMAPEKREFVQHLFAEVTSMLEDAHELAANGQTQTSSVARVRATAKDLTTVANNLLALTGAIDAVLSLQKPPRPMR